MYIYDHKSLGARSLPKNAYYPDRVLDGFLGRGGTNDSFSPACDRSVATPGFSGAERVKLTSLLSPSQSTQAIRWNRETHPAKSGVRLEDIVLDLARYVDFAAVRAAIQKSGGSYTISEGTVDAVFVEAAHQFQEKVYFHADDQSGGVGRSTLDSLGIWKHTLKPKIGDVPGRKFLEKIPLLTNEFSAKNWFDGIVAPSFLGHRINRQGQGIHLLLLRKLREAENYLLSDPKYAGMTPVALGRALGLARQKPPVRYSGGRLFQKAQAMHGVGLALDIDVAGNPWIGAGWIKDDKRGRDWLVDQIKTNPDAQKKEKYKGILNRRNERYRFLETLKSAAQVPLNGGAKGTIFSYLHALAVSHGRDTRGIYEILNRRNEEFKTFLKNNKLELLYWRNSLTFRDKDPLDGFLNLHRDLVFALRQIALLAWGAIDFGPDHSGDIMHFDLRTVGAGCVIAHKLNGYIPRSEHHPSNELREAAARERCSYVLPRR